MDKNLKEISVVSPVFNAENIIEELVERTVSSLKQIANNYEIILVDDGSSDQSWEKIIEQSKKYSNLRGIKLSRNFGQHYAVTAGVRASSGKMVVLMDCDLQDDPKHIEILHKTIHSGYDIVFTKRIRRKHSFFKLITATIYNWLFRLLSDRNYDINVGSLTAFTNRVKIEFVNLGEQDRLYIQMLKWLGFKSTYIEVEHRKRVSGNSSYSFLKLLNMAVQGWTSHSDKLLRSSIYLGFALAGFSFLGIIGIIILYFLRGFQSGWPSMIVTILFSTGLILISLGVTGIYIGKIFQQVKNRPLYIVESHINFEDDSKKNS